MRNEEFLKACTSSKTEEARETGLFSDYLKGKR